MIPTPCPVSLHRCLRIPVLAALVVVLIADPLPLRGQTPGIPGWMSPRPLNLDQDACVSHARRALQSARLNDIHTYRDWSSYGRRRHMAAKIQCASLGRGRSIAAINVAVADGHGNEGNRLRDQLRDCFLDPSRCRVASADNPLDAFTLVRRRAIFGKNKEVLRDMHLEQCARTCLSHGGRGGDWTCRSFDFEDSNNNQLGTCKMSEYDRSSAQLRGHADHDYYERKGSGGPRQSSVLDAFIRLPERAIRGKNKENHPDVSTEQCARACLAHDGRGGDWMCLSFDFRDPEDDGVGDCKLSDHDRSNAGLGRYGNHDYYELKR